MSTCTDTPTRIAVLTPPGSSAIATIAMVGPMAWTLVQARFQPQSGARLPDSPAIGRTWFGKLGDAIADEVIICLTAMMPTPHVEIHCHGGTRIVEMLTNLFRADGCEMVRWTKILRVEHPDTMRASIAIDAMEALSRASTLKTASILLDQTQGKFADAVDRIEFAKSANDTETATRELSELRRWVPLGRHLTRPWSVVIAGAPNVGKSSLLNALTGYQRSIVSATPGTTRDSVGVTLAFDGWPIEIIDTAGMRTTSDRIEQAGIRMASEKVASADVCIWMLDNTAEPVWPTPNVRHLRTIWVRNKADLPSTWTSDVIPETIPLVATTGEGLDGLITAVVSMLIPEVPAAGTAIPFTDTWCDWVENQQEEKRI